MTTDLTSKLTAVQAQTTQTDYAADVLVKSRSQQKLVGAEAVRLIDSTTAQMTKTADGHISVRA